MEAAAESFKRATDYYENLNYDEPEPLPFSPRHWLGAAYMELGVFDKALEQYELDLIEHPHNIWGLWGTNQALDKLGRSESTIEQDLFKAESYADIWIPSTKL